jgi:L-aminopeptidase/D-esterase-like protein
MTQCNPISILEIEGYHLGNAEDLSAGTGCTVILPDQKTLCGLDIRGGAPASRESALLNPLAANDGIHALLLAGGSAYGLDAAGGIMKYLEQKGIGFPVGNNTVVPIVCASCILDLGCGDSHIRPDAVMGIQACMNAEKNNYQDGCHGAGTGATCGKFCGPQYMMKSGIGSAAFQIGELKVGAVICVNCAGDVFDETTGEKIAGAYDRDNKKWLDSEEALYASMTNIQMGSHTTIGAILTNASFNKTELTKIAGMAHDGMARAICPVHTMYDGDSLYALGTGAVKADINLVGTLAAKAVSAAIVNAITSSCSAYGIPSHKEVL